jgi:hypothetical protein
MSIPAFDIPDDVPADDLAEQRRDLDSDTDAAHTTGASPLESDPADWQEQQLVVEDPDAYQGRE